MQQAVPHAACTRACTDPACEPFETGYLKVSDKHELYYEVCGNAAGPAIVLNHGGPGAGCSPRMRRYADPDFYKIVLYDQRGANRSKPNGLMQDNTTWHLVEDLEKLREHLGVDKWHVVMGGSWGSCLSLSYAVCHPDRVGSLVLRGVFVGDGDSMAWLFEQGGASEMYPDAWEAYAGHIPACERHSLLAAYCTRVNSEDLAVALPAAREFVRWEVSISTLKQAPAAALEELLKDDAFVLPFARAETWYFKHACFFPGPDEEDGSASDKAGAPPTFAPAKPPVQNIGPGSLDGNLPWLLRHTDRIEHIPTAIVHGRQDIVCRPRAALELHKRLPHSTLQFVFDAGHSDSEPGLIDGLVAATDRMRTDSLFVSPK